MKNILLVCLLAILCGAAHAEDAPYFTDSDLQKYEGGPAGQEAPPSPAAGRSEIKTAGNRAPKKDDVSRRGYYCNKANELRNKVEERKAIVKSQEETPAVEDAYFINEFGFRQRTVALPGIDMARAKLRAAERELADFERRAYRDGIPPGWLRCQD